MPLSTYAANALINLFARGVAITPPSRIYVSLHTGNSLTGANEVTAAQWPAYARVDPAQGGAIASGFSAAANKETSNLLQMLFSAYNGTGQITLTHFGVWSAPTGGNLLWSGALVVSKTLLPTDECVIYPNDLDLSVN